MRNLSFRFFLECNRHSPDLGGQTSVEVGGLGGLSGSAWGFPLPVPRRDAALRVRLPQRWLDIRQSLLESATGTGSARALACASYSSKLH
jgi:hypothetical protein